MFSLICAWLNRWVNNGEARDLRRYRAHYDVIVMLSCPIWTVISAVIGRGLSHRVLATWHEVPCKCGAVTRPLYTESLIRINDGLSARCQTGLPGDHFQRLCATTYASSEGNLVAVNLESITMTSQWARCRLKSPPSRLFTQPFIQVHTKENSKAPPHWPLCGEFTGDRRVPRTNGQ